MIIPNNKNTKDNFQERTQAALYIFTVRMRKQEQTKKKTAVKNRQNRDYYAKHREEKKTLSKQKENSLGTGCAKN